MAGETESSGGQTAGQVVSFQCPSCGAAVSIHAVGQTVAVTCPSCLCIIDATDENYRILNAAQKKTTLKPLLPLGQKGTLFGNAYEVVGFMQRCDETGFYRWHEYLLFNPFQGYRWLVMYQGHWNFYTMVKDRPTIEAHTATYQGKDFDLYLQGAAVVRYVLGEFYWRVKVGDSVGVADYICPPQILSREADGAEVVWSLGQYIEPEVVSSAFKIADALPFRLGIAPNQPSPFGGSPRKIAWLTVAFCAVLFLVQLYTVGNALDEEVLRQDFSTVILDTNKTLVSQKFRLSKDSANLEITSHAPVANSWVDLDMELVNADNGEARPLFEEVAYYYGSDSDGSWTEGAQENHSVMPTVPGGSYYLSIEPTTAPELRSTDFNIVVKRDVPQWSNFVIAVVLMLVFPVIVWWRTNMFEHQRWQDSDYSPLTGGGS